MQATAHLGVCDNTLTGRERGSLALLQWKKQARL